MLHYRNETWSTSEKQAYLQFLRILREADISLQKIMLYSLARPSQQPEANEILKVSQEEMAAFANEISALGYDVSISV